MRMIAIMMFSALSCLPVASAQQLDSQTLVERIQGEWTRMDSRGTNVSTDYFPPDAGDKQLGDLAQAFLNRLEIRIRENKLIFSDSGDLQYAFVVGELRQSLEEKVPQVICLQGKTEIQLGLVWLDKNENLNLSFHTGLTEVRKPESSNEYSKVSLQFRRATNLRLGWTVTYRRKAEN